ncbi:MAG: hypothetical protein HY787_25915 [Deltaproteobacteria bacterium]|nr:hypothetical protein [Deltaproteobacteria bacterium]
MIEKDKKVVAVGMSGGVDSTMAALMLKEEGFRGIGLAMSLWNQFLKIKSSKNGCYGPNEVKDIDSDRRVASKVGHKASCV